MELKQNLYSKIIKDMFLTELHFLVAEFLTFCCIVIVFFSENILRFFDEYVSITYTYVCVHMCV